MTEEKKYGIENVKKCLAVFLEGGNIAGEIVSRSGEEVKWYEKFLVPFVKMGDELMALFSVDYKLVLPEFGEIDAEEKAELLAWAQEKFDIPQDNVEEKVEQAFKYMFMLGDILKEVIQFVKDLKK